MTEYISGIPKDEFYLTRGLTTQQIELIDGCYAIGDDDKEVLREVIPQYAKMRGVESKDLKLRKAQIDPVLMSYITKRFFIGDKPGLGKTVMSAAAYAYYGLMQLKQNKEIEKIIVVTEAAHVVKFAKEWNTYGLSVVPLTGGSTKVAKTLDEFEFTKNDGVVIGWDGLKTNGFLEFYFNHHQEFQYIVLDETSKLRNPKAMLYKTVDQIVNHYQGGIERVIMLNGSTFEKNIYDFYYQFNILQPKLIPSKKWLDDRYVVKEFDSVFRRDARGKVINQKFANIVDYQNQAELKERLRYYYVARSKEDYTDDIPQHSYKLHVVYLTPQQTKVLSEQKQISLVNSPKTSDPDAEFNRDTSPKLDLLLDFFVKVDKDRPIVYVYNIEAQNTINQELNNMGYKSEILNGDASAEEKAAIIDRFNNYELDTLVFNVQKAVNIPTSDRIIFYDIPTMPQQTSQIKARIDRNNYTTVKHYNFFVYYQSPEWVNLSRLGHFREHHSNEFTGQHDHVYSELVEQMNEFMGDEVARQVEDVYEQMYRDNQKFKDVEPILNKLLNIL